VAVTTVAEPEARALVREAEEIARGHENETLRDPVRVLILAILMALGGEASWSDIKRSLRTIYGSINPNTMAFHLRWLRDRGMLSVADLEDPVFRLLAPPSEERVNALSRKIRRLMDLGG